MLHLMYLVYNKKTLEAISKHSPDSSMCMTPVIVNGEHVLNTLRTLPKLY